MGRKSGWKEHTPHYLRRIGDVCVFAIGTFWRPHVRPLQPHPMHASLGGIRKAL